MPWYAILAMRKTARYNDLLEPRYLPKSPSRDGRGAGRCSGWMRSSPMRRKKGAPRVELHVSQDLNWFGRFCFEFYVFLILFMFKCAKGALRLKVSWNQIENGSNSIAKISFFGWFKSPFCWSPSSERFQWWLCIEVQARAVQGCSEDPGKHGPARLSQQGLKIWHPKSQSFFWRWLQIMIYLYIYIYIYIYIVRHKQREHAENLWCTMAWDKPARLLGQGKQNHGNLTAVSELLRQDSLLSAVDMVPKRNDFEYT